MLATVALAIGIGASTAMFGVLDAVVLQPLPFAQEERLVAGWKTARTDPTRLVELSYPEFLQWQAQSTSFESLAALPTTVYGYSYVLTGRGDPVAVESARVTSEFFEVLGVRPMLGRAFIATDEREGAQPTVVLGSGVRARHGPRAVRACRPDGTRPTGSSSISPLIDGASDPSSARHYFPDDVEGWLKLTGYHGDAADKAHELCETAISTLLDAAEADTNETSRNILLGQVENLLHASGLEPLLVARLEEERGHTAEAREAYEQAGTAEDVRRILRKQAEWEEAAALDGDNADLEWLLKVDRVAAARPAGLGARLYEQERRWLAETLEKMRDDDRAEA